MFSRGNATSGAPICSGMITLANPMNRGVANISSMIVPCMVNSWLYCSLDRNCSPGLASSARISSASTPPNRKKQNELMMYMKPMTLWSVDVSQLTTTLPRGSRCQTAAGVAMATGGSPSTVTSHLRSSYGLGCHR